MKQVHAVSILAGVTVLLVLWLYSRSESYCFFYPSIDTHYAPGYSEVAFNQVRTGMTTQAVRQLLGEPLGTLPQKDGTEVWFYSDDGKALFGDWAWIGREVVVRSNQVVEVVKTIYYD